MKPLDFARRQMEVAGDHLASVKHLEVPEDCNVPCYIPRISTGGSRRDHPVESDFVALSLYDLFALKGADNYRSRFSGARDLRKKFKLKQDTKILVVANNFDRRLERFWRYHDRLNVVRNLSEFNLWGLVIPNFSFFREAPRTHSLYSRKRIEFVMKTLTSAGLPIIPHLQASVYFEKDWEYWLHFLRRYPEVRTVSAEFGTGWLQKELADRAIEKMRELSGQLGRPLHLLALAGGGVYRELRDVFETVTLVNHTPYMKAMKRQRLGLGMNWEHSPTLEGESVSAILDHNIRVYSERVSDGKPVEEIPEIYEISESYELLPLAENF
ncbi:DUF4417 domain-containing protein [Coraliomargarita sinensis]|nr:DUF4417 domain-containing protein [Coraliomargarita sinensis]